MASVEQYLCVLMTDSYFFKLFYGCHIGKCEAIVLKCKCKQPKAENTTNAEKIIRKKKKYFTYDIGQKESRQ